MTHAQQGRAFLATEWGVNGLPWAQSALATGGDGDALMLAQAEVVYEKWIVLQRSGTSGGFAFIWADEPNHGFFIPHWLEITGAIEYPPGSGYHPLNEEEYWGFNDVHRRARPSLAALRYAYSGEGEAPIVGLPGPGG